MEYVKAHGWAAQRVGVALGTPAPGRASGRGLVPPTPRHAGGPTSLAALAASLAPRRRELLLLRLGSKLDLQGSRAQTQQTQWDRHEACAAY